MVQLTFSSYQTGQHSTVKVTLVSAESSGELATSLHLEMVFAEAGPNPGISRLHCINTVNPIDHGSTTILLGISQPKHNDSRSTPCLSTSQDNCSGVDVIVITQSTTGTSDK